MKVEIVNKSNNAYPRYETSGSAGIDLRANLNNEEAGEYHETLAPGEMRVIGTGLYMSIPEGYEGQIRSRSGLAASPISPVTAFIHSPRLQSLPSSDE